LCRFPQFGSPPAVCGDDTTNSLVSFNAARVRANDMFYDIILTLAALIPYSLPLDLATHRSVPGTPFQRCKMKVSTHPAAASSSNQQTKDPCTSDAPSTLLTALCHSPHPPFLPLCPLCHLPWCQFDKDKPFNLDELARTLSITAGQRTMLELWQKKWELQGCPGSVVGAVLKDATLPQGHILVRKWDCPNDKATADQGPRRYTLWVLSPEGKATKHSEFIKRNAGATPTGQVAAPAAAAPVSLPDAPRDPAAAAGPSNPTDGAPPAPAINAAPASDDQPDNDEQTKRVSRVITAAAVCSLSRCHHTASHLHKGGGGRRRVTGVRWWGGAGVSGVTQKLQQECIITALGYMQLMCLSLFCAVTCYTLSG
jgi:hypothetical protein